MNSFKLFLAVSLFSLASAGGWSLDVPSPPSTSLSTLTRTTGLSVPPTLSSLPPQCRGPWPELTSSMLKLAQLNLRTSEAVQGTVPDSAGFPYYIGTSRDLGTRITTAKLFQQYSALVCAFSLANSPDGPHSTPEASRTSSDFGTQSANGCQNPGDQPHTFTITSPDGSMSVTISSLSGVVGVLAVGVLVLGLAVFWLRRVLKRKEAEIQGLRQDVVRLNWTSARTENLLSLPDQPPFDLPPPASPSPSAPSLSSPPSPPPPPPPPPPSRSSSFSVPQPPVIITSPPSSYLPPPSVPLPRPISFVPPVRFRPFPRPPTVYPPIIPEEEGQK